MPLISDTDLDRAVLTILQRECVGKRHAIERWTLVERVFGAPVPQPQRNDDNIEDRLIRYAVSRLRRQGHLICDLGDGNGRFLAANAEEFWEMYQAYIKPIKARAEVARVMKKAAERQFPNLNQPSLFTTIQAVEDWETV